MPANAPGSDAAIAAKARALSAIYWDLAEELRSASVALVVAQGADSDLLVVSVERMALAMKAGMILHYLADRPSK
jgi:hypothetical protein